jgi:capsular polysaccharide biosynthesis protein
VDLLTEQTAIQSGHPGRAEELLPASAKHAGQWSWAWSGRVGGKPPSWWKKDPKIPGRALTIYTFDNVYFWPKTGVVALSDGTPLYSSSKQATYYDFGLKKHSEQLRSTRDESIPRIASLTVAIPWGGLNNYGHFILDGLAAVSLMESRKKVAHPIGTPPLRDWQRAHFDLLGIDPLELPGDIYKVDRVTFSSGANYSLHFPNTHFLTLRELQLACVNDKPSPPLVYLSRKGQKRQIVNEARLIVELEKLGFTCFQPETLSVVEQINLFHKARVICGATGAAFGNALYCSRGARIIEIIPPDMSRNGLNQMWVAYLAAMTGGDWCPYFTETQESGSAPSIGGKTLTGYMDFEIDDADVLRFVRKAMRPDLFAYPANAWRRLAHYRAASSLGV